MCHFGLGKGLRGIGTVVRWDVNNVRQKSDFDKQNLAEHSAKFKESILKMQVLEVGSAKVITSRARETTRR